MSSYAEAFRQSVEDPETFWLDAARGVDWVNAPTRALDGSEAPSFRWFPDGTLNTSVNALDRHVQAGHGDRTALIWDSAMVPAKRTYTYSELLDEVAVFAGVLRDQGIVAGDRVIVYMPMIPEAAIAMLACARIGAVHSVVFGGFAAKELATRIDDAQPALLVTASGGLEPGRTVEYLPMVEQAIGLSQTPPHTVIVKDRESIPGSAADYKTSSAAWFDWDELVADATPADPVPVAATDPLYILYTSGTTGKPKGVVRDNGGHAVALTWSMRNIYDISAGDVWWTASDVGWVVGHSYIVYGPLLHGATSIMYEGKPVGTPDAGAYWRVISQHKAVAFFTAPTAFRAIKKEDPEGKFLPQYDLSKFRTLFLAGERADPPTVQWAEEKLGKPVVDHWWQTETGWCIAGNPVGLGMLPVKHGSATVPMPGWDIRVLDESGKEVPAGAIGSIVAKLPMPPGAFPTLWQNDERFREAYLSEFPGYYKTADAGFLDADGYVNVMGRTDDIINVAGHRLSTGGMEEVLASHSDVAECAVIGMADTLKGEVPCGFVVLKAGATRDPADIEREIVQLVRERIGPVAAFKLAITVPRLPKTRSGKILRGTMKKIADGEAWTMPATIEDPKALDEIGEAVKSRGTP